MKVKPVGIKNSLIGGAVATALLALGGCASAPPAARAANQSAASLETAPDFGQQRNLASFSKPSEQQACYDRSKEPYTAVVDAHFHPRPFGGQAIVPVTLQDYVGKAGVRFINYFGIGQILDMQSACIYYLDCPGVAAKPSIKNDFVNGMEAKAYKNDNLHVVLSMTFMDLAHPEDVVKTIALYDKEYPGMFKWAGELNVMKQALVPNLHEPATLASIDKWAPFMKVLRERGIPITLHSDLGNDAEPTKYLYLMQHVLKKYPDNKIVWAHMGLSKELATLPAEEHVEIMKGLLNQYPNLILDISWDVLFNTYQGHGGAFIGFFNEYSDRILQGSDFVAAGSKSPGQYAKELEITSRVNQRLDDEAFRRIALGENYFRLLNLPYHAPQVCKN